MDFINKITSFFSNKCDNDNYGGDEDDDGSGDEDYSNNNFSYILKKKTIRFDNQFNFNVRYFVKQSEIWLVGRDFAKGIGYKNANTAVHCFVDSKYKIALDDLINGSVVESEYDNSVWCINKHGVLQLLDNIDFENKAEFTAWLLDTTTFYETTTSTVTTPPLDQKITQAVELMMNELKQNNANQIRSNQEFSERVAVKFGQFEERLNKFENKLAQLHGKLNSYENLSNLYTRLCDHHQQLNVVAEPASLRPNTIRMPKDESKHPRLAVFVKADPSGGTEIAYMGGQRKHYLQRKRKYKDMELVYDAVHPNPQMAIHCINEELDSKQYKIAKKSKRTVIVECDVDVAKSLIVNNV